jgi:hypothetical protein
MAGAGLTRSVAVLALSWATGALVSGCASTPTGDPHLLDFLVDGRTTCDEVRQALGPPEAEFQGQSILAYRLGEDERGYTQGVQVPPGYAPIGHWYGYQYSLIVVCGPTGVVERHSLVDLKPAEHEAKNEADQ